MTRSVQWRELPEGSPVDGENQRSRQVDEEQAEAGCHVGQTQ